MPPNFTTQFSPEAAFGSGLNFTGYNPLSFSLGDYVGAPAPVSSGISTLNAYNPSSFVGDVGNLSAAAAPSLWNQMGTKDFWLGGYNDKTGQRTMGAGGMALGAAQGLFNGWLGMKQYGLAKEQMAFQKNSFAKNWEAQKTSVNSQLEDRQRARVASNAGAYQSVGDYMKQNGIA